MASVSSLDQDMRKLRLDRYTTGAANEVRSWIEEVLGEKLPGGDLMDALRDGVALCKSVHSRNQRLSHELIMPFQTRQPLNLSRSKIQAVEHAICADGKHLPLPPRMRNATAEPPIA